LAWQLGAGQELTAAIYAYRQYDAPRTDKCSPESCLVFDRQEYDLTYLRYRGAFGPVHDLTAGVALSRTGEQRSQRDAIADMVERERDQVLGVSAYARAAFSPWRIGAATLHGAVGVDGYREGLASEAAIETGDRTDALLRGKYLDGSSQGALGAHGVAELWLGERVSFDVGLRLSANRARVSADPESGASGFVTWQTLPVGSAGVVARMAGPVSLAVHVDRAFRAPDLYDLTARSSGAGPGYQLPNPALEAETAYSLEAGFQVRSPRLVADLFGYATNLRDFITREQTSCPPELADRCGDAGAVFRAVNADAAAVRGLEAAARLELGAGLSLLGSATWTRGDARFAGGMTEPLPKVPPLHGVASARFADVRRASTLSACAPMSLAPYATTEAQRAGGRQQGRRAAAAARPRRAYDNSAAWP
jgi:outer membrane receptor protein involved in Fe transport